MTKRIILYIFTTYFSYKNNKTLNQMKNSMANSTKENVKGMIISPGLEGFMKLYSSGVHQVHVGKDTLSDEEIQIGIEIQDRIERELKRKLRFTVVERYQRFHNVGFLMYDGKPELYSVDGNTDLEDTYNKKFLDAMYEGCVEAMDDHGDGRDPDYIIS